MRKKENGMWRRTIRIFESIRVPWELYLLQVVLGVVSAKVSLLYIPYFTQMQTGSIDDPHTVVMYIVFMLLSLMMTLIVAIPQFYSEGILNRQLKDMLIGRILRFPLRRFEQEKPARLISRVTSDVSYASLLMQAVVSFSVGFVSVFMAYSEMKAVNTSISFLLIPVIAYSVFATWFDGKLIFLAGRREMYGYSVTTAYFAEHTAFLLNARQINGQKHEIQMGSAAINATFHAAIYGAVLDFFRIIVSSSASNVNMILVFVFGSRLVRQGAISIEGLVAFYNYSQVLYSNATMVINLYHSAMQANGTLYYLGKLLEIEPEQILRERGMDQNNEDIILENVSFSYEKGRPVLKNVNAIIPKGKVTAIIGANGTGKTTLFKLLERFYEPDEGTIYFGKTDVRTIHLDQWRRSFGYVLQQPQLFNASIRDNVAYGAERDVTDEEVLAATRVASAQQFIADCPGGLDYMIGDNGSRLSEGQKQRLAIARSVMTDPAYLLLDEATSSMDVEAREQTRKAISTLMKGRTTVFICHDMQTLRLADHVIVLKDGMVEAQGDLDTVRQISPAFRMMEEAESF